MFFNPDPGEKESSGYFAGHDRLPATGKIIQSVPKYDDCVRLAKENGVSLADMYQSICS